VTIFLVIVGTATSAFLLAVRGSYAAAYLIVPAAMGIHLVWMDAPERVVGPPSSAGMFTPAVLIDPALEIIGCLGGCLRSGPLTSSTPSPSAVVGSQAGSEESSQAVPIRTLDCAGDRDSARSAGRLRKAAAMAAEQAERRAAQLDAPERRRGRPVATGVALAAVKSRGAKFRGTKDEPHGPPTS
jgi:hypothetical protein